MEHKKDDYTMEDSNSSQFDTPEQADPGEMSTESVHVKDPKDTTAPSRLRRLLGGPEPNVDPGPPPDGGLKAYTQMVMGHLAIFNCWGYIAAFGAFQAYYVEQLGHPPSDISWM